MPQLTVKQSLETLEKVLTIFAPITTTTIDDVVLEHVTALKNSGPFLELLEKDLDGWLGREAGEGGALAFNLGDVLQSGPQLFFAILNLVKLIREGADLTTIVKAVAELLSHFQNISNDAAKGGDGVLK